MAQKMSESQISELERLEDAVRAGSGTDVRARWKSGHYLLTLKKGKQLPNGLLARLQQTRGVKRSEIHARMAFAAKFPTDAALTDAVEQFKTWHAITHGALTSKPRTAKASDEADSHHVRQIQGALKRIQNINVGVVGAPEIALLQQLAATVTHLLASERAQRKPVQSLTEAA